MLPVRMCEGCSYGRWHAAPVRVSSLPGARSGTSPGAGVRVRPCYGRTLVKTGRFEPTSQTCSTCGIKDGPKPLNVREWTCAACGTVHDRDTNAAINVKQAAGLAASACGARRRPGAIPAPREETGSHGIPIRHRAAKRHSTR